MNDTVKDPEDRGDLLPEDVASDAPDATAPETAPPDATAPEIAPPEPMIPHARFEELNQKLKLEQASRLELEGRLNALAQQAHAPPPFDAVAAEKEYLKAVLDGNVDAASALMSAIRAHDRQQLEAEIAARTQQQIERATARTALETVADAALQQYPFLDPNQTAHDPAAVAEVVEWRDYYVVAKGLTPAKALKAAVDRIAPAYAKKAPATEPPGRTLAQRQVNAQAAAHQPPALVGVGERAARQTPTDVMKMTDVDFAALSAADKAKLRGDLAA